MDELDLLWDEIIAYDPSYVDQYEKHIWRKDILEDDGFFRDMYNQSKERGFASLSKFSKVEDYWNKTHGIKKKDGSFQSGVDPLVSDEMNANTADSVYNPDAEWRGEIGQLPNAVRMLTWKNNKDIINGITTFAGTGIPGFEGKDESENVKRRLMSGKWGLDTQTGALYVLPESQREAANQEELRLAENIDIRRKKENLAKEEIAKAQKAKTTQNKLIAVNKWVQTQTTSEVLQSDDGYKAKYINSYDIDKINSLNPINKSWMNILQGHDKGGNISYFREFAFEDQKGEGAIFNENYINSWWNPSTMQDYKNLSPKFFGQGGIHGSNFELRENQFGNEVVTFMKLNSGTLVNGEEKSLNAQYQAKFTELDKATREFETIQKGEKTLMGVTYGEQGYGEEEYMNAAYRYARATQDFMDFYFEHHIDGVAAKAAFSNVEANKTMAISSQQQILHTTKNNPTLDPKNLAIKINDNLEKSIFSASVYQIGTSDREWKREDAEDMAELNVQSNEFRNIYQEELGELAQTIYTFRGVSGKKGQDAAIAEAISKMEKSEIYAKLKGLSSTYQEIIGRGEGISGRTAVQVIDITTGKPVRKGDADLTKEAQQAIQDYETTVKDLSSGIFSNNTIKNVLLDIQSKLLNDMTAFQQQNVSQKELGSDKSTLGAMRDYFGSESSQKEFAAMKKTIEEFQKTGLINFKHLRHIEGNTPLIQSYNSKINTLRALSEVYLMNFDPILSLENENARIDVDFWGDQSSDFGVSEEFKYQAADRLVKGMERGLPEAFGINASREGLYDDEIQQEFVTSMINDFGIGKDITVFDEETGKDIVVNSLQNELNTRLENVSTYYKIGRQVPTFAVMIAETVAIEFLTVGMGSGVALANISRRATQMYHAFGIGRKTASVMGGWTKMMLHEALILEGSNQIGSHAWGREKLPVWSFAIGSSLARSGMTGLGTAFTKFNTNMLSKTAQLKSPMARKWASATSLIKNNPLLVGTPLKAAAYVPKKMLQATIGTATIKSGEVVGSIADVFAGELSWKQFWDHTLDADAFIEMFGTMLVLGTRSGLKDGRLGFKTAMGNIKNLGSTSGTRKFNAAGDMFGLRKLKNYSEKNHETGKSSWSRLEIDTALNKKIKEINKDPNKTAGEKQKEINNLQEISKFLKLKGEVDQTRYDEPAIWDAAYGDESMSGEFENLIKRLGEGTETNMMDQLKLGQISSWSEGANRNSLIKELMAATGMEELKAKDYVDWCENLAKVNTAYGFRNGSKHQRKFFKLQSEGYRLEAELEQLKESHKKGEVNKATLDFQSEIIKEKQTKLLEQEKNIIDLETKETKAAIQKMKDEIVEAEVIETKEGQSVNQAIIDLFETGEFDASKNRGLKGQREFLEKNLEGLKEVEKIKEEGKLIELLEMEGYEVNRSSDYGVHLNIEVGGKTKVYTIIDKAKASTAQIKFNEKFERTKPILAEGKSFTILSNAKRNTLFHEIIHPWVAKAIATNPKFVNDFINTIKKTGEYEAVLAEVKKHVDYKEGYEGSEWLTIYGEMVKDGFLDGMVKPKNRRLWKNLSSKLKKVVNENTPFKDANFETGNGTREFLIRFAKAKGSELTKISKSVNKGIKEYKDWIAEGKTKEGEEKLFNMSSERLKEFKVEVKNIAPKFNDLYRKYRHEWNDAALELKDEAGWQKAIKDMEKEGMLDRLIYARLRKVKNTKLSIDQANYVEMVYSELNSLVKGFDAVLQTTSGAGGFFAYVNTYLGRKAIDVNKALGVYDFTKSLDQMKESGFDVADGGGISTEVYTKITAKQNARKMGLKEESIEQLNRDMKKLDFDKLIKAYETPRGPNQTISPFVREFKKQFGEKGTEAVEESMGTTKKEYKAYVEKNMEGIVRGLPVGYISRNFPFLIEGGPKEVTGSTGRHKHWTSGPQSMKVKENFSLLDLAKFTEAAVPSRWGAKKKSMAYQIADSYGSKKFLETIEAKNEIEYKLDQAEKDLHTSKLELDNKEITQTEFDSRRNAYMETVKDLLAQGDVASEFGKAFKPKKIEAGDFTLKINQQIEISNFRRSASAAEDIRVYAGSDATLRLEITDNLSSLLKAKLRGKLLKAGWPHITETQLKNIIKDATEFEGKPIDLGNGFTVKAALARSMAKDLLKTASQVVEGYTFSKGNIKNRIEREAKDLKGDIEKIKADEIADFEIQKTLDRGLEVSESAKLKKQLGIEGSAKQMAIEYADLGVEHTMKYLNKKLKDAFANEKDPAEVVLNWLKYNTNQLVSAGGPRGHRGQFFSGKPDLFETMKPLLKEYGIDMEWKLTEAGSLKTGSLKIDGKVVKTDIKTKGQNPKSLRWVMDYVKEIEADPNWAKNNPEKFNKLEKEINEREVESKEFQKALLDEMVEDFKDFKNGEIDKKLLFLKLNSYNTNMTTHLRSAANLTDVMIPLKGDRLKNLTVEHKRAADPLLRELTAIFNNKGSWLGKGETLRLNKKAKVLLDEAFESYETALIETFEKGEKKTLDKLLEDQYKTNKAHNVIKGGERYGRALNEATLGDPRSRAFLNLKEYIKTKDYEGSKYGKIHEIAAKIAMDMEVTKADRKIVENISPSIFPRSSTKGKTKQELIDITKTADKALGNGRKINAKKKKARIFDFDDTVGITKSNVIYSKRNTTGKPSSDLKAIVMAGGPGSGKSTVIKKLGLQKQGYKVVNQDISLEWAKKLVGLDAKEAEYDAVQRSVRSELGALAIKIADKKLGQYTAKGKGVILDGTGASIKATEAKVKALEEKGYDVSMIYVETSKQTALDRNRNRKERSLKDKIVETTWNSVNANKQAYRNKFGKSFFEVDANKPIENLPPEVIKNIDSKLNETIRGKISPAEFAEKGEAMEAEGAKLDFSEFNKVIDGKKGPLFDVMKRMKEAAGDRDMFILTARSQESAPAIHKFLKKMGIDIPLENIKGLGDSTGEAKAQWIVDKAAEGYNDFYFADDAIANVEAVKKALDPLDIKSKVQQARFNRSSENLDMMFNKIIEGKTGIEWRKEFSSAKAKIRGKQNQKRKFWIPASAEDFSGLMDWTLGKGKIGEQQKEFYKEVLYKPYSRGVQSLATERVNMMSDFKALKKQLEIPKDLREVTESGYNKEQALRTYLWTKTGQKIPGLSKTDLVELNTIIESDGKLHAFAESILQLTKGDGYNKPGKNWLTGTITTDLIDILKTTKRSKYLKEWKDNVDVLFSSKNLNKLEAAYGPKYREALENILTRMKSGSNRTNTGNRLSDGILDYINGAQGTIMFLNMRSALLQTISAANFLDFGFNNPIKAGKAFANQPQYWKDFMEIMNSDYLVDRRNGLKMNISESEIADAAASGGNKAKAAINYILEKGYLPTRFADSFAIASGGATWYRNRIKDLMKKENLSEQEAKKKAFDEFREISEKSQQSSDPSKISQQQSSDAGRLLLQFVNTPMQYARLQKSAFKDLINGRGKAHEKIGKILYYGVIQNLWFNAAQSALFALGFGDFSEDEKEGKTLDTANGMVDSILRGLGMGGMTLSVFKNTLMDVYERMGKTKPEFSEVWDTLLQFSPALKSKLTKIKGAGRQFDSKEGRQEVVDKGFSLDNPAYASFAKVFSAVTNVPLDRLFTKFENVQGALNDENEWWQRIAMGLGWPQWQLQTSKDKSEKRNQELQDYKYSEAKKDQSKYSKAEQVEILKKHGYTDDEIKEMKVEGVRVATIKKAEGESGNVYTSKIIKEKKDEKDVEYQAYERKPVVKLTKRQKDSTNYMNMNKPEQVSKLDSLGLSKKEIRELQYEADRVDKLLELMSE